MSDGKVSDLSVIYEFLSTANSWWKFLHQDLPIDGTWPSRSWVPALLPPPNLREQRIDLTALQKVKKGMIPCPAVLYFSNATFLTKMLLSCGLCHLPYNGILFTNIIRYTQYNIRKWNRSYLPTVLRHNCANKGVGYCNAVYLKDEHNVRYLRARCRCVLMLVGMCPFFHSWLMSRKNCEDTPYPGTNAKVLAELFIMRQGTQYS